MGGEGSMGGVTVMTGKEHRGRSLGHRKITGVNGSRGSGAPGTSGREGS